MRIADLHIRAALITFGASRPLGKETRQAVFVTSELLEELNRKTEQLSPTIINFEGRVINELR